MEKETQEKDVLSKEIKEDFLEEEIRWDYLVIRKQKKVWAKELEILQYFDEICRKHNLKYHIDCGTLLGAVRHKGFIPWDDDIDVTMCRPDYEILKAVMAEEIREPYFFQTVYTDNLMFHFAKIRNSETTAIEEKYCSQYPPHQGIYIDIFPLDATFEEKNTPYERMERELWLLMTDQEKVISAMEKGVPFFLPYDMLKELLQMSIRERMQYFEGLLIGNYEKSSKIAPTMSVIFGSTFMFDKSWYDDVVYLPFEGMMLPAPIGYEEVLKRRYGDYMTPVKDQTLHNGILLDPDRSYLEYYKERGLI